MVCLAALSWSSGARAERGPYTVRAEGGLAFMLTSPQTDHFDLGGGGALGFEYRLLDYLGAEVRGAVHAFPSAPFAPTEDGFGSYYALGLALRGYPMPDLELGDLWLGLGGNLVFTGDEKLFGLEAGVGFDFDILWWLRAGPYVRYAHVFESGAFNAGFMHVGVSIALLGDRPEEPPPPEPEPPPAPVDTDADGLLDPDDLCPTEPEDMDGFEDENGCPDPDNDQDGVLDADDQCPTEQEDRDGFRDDDGCPDTDNDQDGFADDLDRCPDEPETVNQYEDEDGCPDERPAVDVELERLAHQLYFPNDRVRLTPPSRRVLAQLVELLQAHPELTKVRIEAHASETGTPEYNLELSRRRAERVVRRLVEAGIEESRLEIQALGDSQPAVPGDHEDAHTLNRRVEFVVIERGATASPESPDAGNATGAEGEGEGDE